MESKFKLAWISGIVYFSFSFPEAVFEILYHQLAMPPIPAIFYSVIEISVMLSAIFFIRGFILIGREEENDTLLTAAYINLFFIIAISIYSIMIARQYSAAMDIIEVAIAIISGFIAIFYGKGLYEIKDTYGRKAEIAGILSIIAGISFVIFPLFFIGLILLIPVLILEILILADASHRYQKTALAA